MKKLPTIQSVLDALRKAEKAAIFFSYRVTPNGARFYFAPLTNK